MRTLMLTSLALTLAFTTVPLMASPKDKNESGPPGSKKEGWVPPGLEKKGGLPPGQAKKQDKQKKHDKDRDSDADDAESPANPPAAPTDKPVVVDTPTPPEPKPEAAPEVKALPLPPKDSSSRPPPPRDTTATKTTKEPTVNPPKVDPVQARKQLEQQVQSLNRLDNNRVAAAAGWSYVIERSGITQATIQQQRKAFPNLSPAAALCGNLIAKQGGIPFNKVTAERAKGRQWGVLAEHHKVSVESLTEALTGLETAMHQAAPVAKAR